MTKKLTRIIFYLLSVQVVALTTLTILRCVLYFANINLAANIPDKSCLVFRALLKGLHFDNLIASYVMLIPLVVLSILALSNKIYKGAIKFFNIYFIICYAIVFMISAADIPYFKYFFSHLDVSVFHWMGFGATTAGMIFQETSYYIYFSLYVILLVAFGLAVFYFGRRVYTLQSSDLSGKQYVIAVPCVILLWGLCFIGIRGGVDRYPLRVSNSYFCSNTFINQLGANPTFYLIKSTISFYRKYNNLEGLMSNEQALKFVQKELNSESKNGENPIGRYIKSDKAPSKVNVVIVLMESMSSEYMKIESNGRPLTPFLNKLKNESYYFDNFYSAGIHTNNGIAATLYGYPTQFDKTMMDIKVTNYRGLPVNLKERGYQTLFFLTSNPQYDNMNSFFIENGFDRIYSQYDYPRSKVVNNFGVQDDYLFEYGLSKLKEISKNDKPFLATFMTITNHPPYVIPPKYRDIAENDEYRAVAFADDCVQTFMQEASKQDWYQNTIFVLLGDHGRTIGSQSYDMALSYNQIPMFIYSPMFKDMPKRFSQFGGQIDVFPTIMGLLGESYTNNSLGIDLFREKRPYIYFVSNTHLGCIDDKHLYIYNPQDKKEGLYDYRNLKTDNIISDKKAEADSMRQYSFSMMITADYLKNNDFKR